MLLKNILQLKKGEDTFSSKTLVFESELRYGLENNKEVTGAIPGDLLKPFLVGDKYIIVKVVNKITPKVLSYEKAKDLAKNDYEKVALGLELEKQASKALENFEGKNIGLVSRDSVDKIEGLTREETLTFLSTLFSSTEKTGKITVGDKVVLYKINSSQLASYDSAKDVAIKSNNWWVIKSRVNDKLC